MRPHYLLLLCLMACGDDPQPATDTQPDTDIQPDTSPDPDTDTSTDTSLEDTDVGPTLWPHTLTATPRLITPFAVADPLRVQPSIAIGEDQRLALAWTGRNGASLGIVLSLVTLDDTPEAAPGAVAPLIANTDTTGNRNEPSLCALTGGGYALAWSVDLQNGADNLQIAWRRFGPDLTPLDPADRIITTDRPGNHWLGELACDPRGGFVVAGVRAGAENSGFSAFFQRVSANGIPEPAVSALTEDPLGGSAFGPQPAVAPSGEVVLIWEQTGVCPAPPCDDTTMLAYRRFAPVGGALEFLIATTTDASGPVVAVDGTGVALLGGVLGNTLNLALDHGTRTPLDLPALGVTTSSAAVSTGDGQFALVHFQGTGANVALMYHALVDTTFAAPLTLDSGSFPLAYRPALTARGDLRVAAWTESMGQGRFRVRLAAFTDRTPNH